MPLRCLVAAFVLAACADAPPPAEDPSQKTPSDKGVTTATAPSERASSGDVSTAIVSEPTPPPPEPQKPKLADESTAPGIVPLTAAEDRESKKDCGPSLTKLRSKVKGESGRIARTKKLVELLQEPGAVSTRCRELLTRSILGYLAATNESTAVINLKTMLVGLSSHFDKTGKLCASAGPAVDDPAWQCVNASPSPGTRFTYRLVVGGNNYTLSAVGSPVDGVGATELFISGSVDDGKINLGAPVMRRAPK